MKQIVDFNVIISSGPAPIFTLLKVYQEIDKLIVVMEETPAEREGDSCCAVFDFKRNLIIETIDCTQQLPVTFFICVPPPARQNNDRDDFIANLEYEARFYREPLDFVALEEPKWNPWKETINYIPTNRLIPLSSDAQCLFTGEIDISTSYQDISVVQERTNIINHSLGVNKQILFSSSSANSETDEPTNLSRHWCNIL
jgi:hypothetical protein